MSEKCVSCSWRGDELYKHCETCATWAAKLADKERELSHFYEKLQGTDGLLAEATDKLTAANAVVEAAEAWADWIESNEWTPINTVQGDLLRAIEKWRGREDYDCKLQGGDGE